MSTRTIERRALVRALAGDRLAPVIWDPRLGRVRPLTKAERRAAERSTRHRARDRWED